MMTRHFSLSGTWMRLCLLCMAALAHSDHRIDAEGQPSKTPTSSFRRWAVVVGVGAYQDKAFRTTPSGARDARDVAACLSRLGYREVLRLSDERLRLKPSLGRIQEQIPAFLSDPRIGEEDVVLIYFSSHGFSVRGEAYLAARDTRLARGETTGVALSWLQDQLAACRAKRKVLVLDAAREQGRAGSKKPFLPEGVLAAARRSDIATFASCGPGEVSRLLRGVKDQPDARNTAFAYYLTWGLTHLADADKDRTITVSELQAYLRREVREWARRQGQAQTPELHAVSANAQIPVAEVHDSGVGGVLTGAGILAVVAARNASGQNRPAATPGAGSPGGAAPPVPPRVVSASSPDGLHADVVFDLPLDAVSASVAGNYTLSPPLTVSGADLQADGKTVRLVTSQQAPATTYTVTARDVQSALGAIIGTDNTATFVTPGAPPKVVSATSVGRTHLDVLFNMILQAASANNPANYTVTVAAGRAAVRQVGAGGERLDVFGAVLQADGKTVRLATSDQTADTTYTVTAANVQDTYGNKIGDRDNSADFDTPPVPLKVLSATAVDSTHVDVLFSEALDPATANVAGGYSIAPALAVGAAALQADGKTVRLTTAEQTGGTTYTVTVAGVKDLAGTTIASTDNTATFTGIGDPPRVLSATAVDSTPG
ncbi:MAG: caspase family protein, partial [Armatimonadetes bacterium]|nr:caspase family protein [Armatimonadota bacterium]